VRLWLDPAGYVRSISKRPRTILTLPENESLYKVLVGLPGMQGSTDAFD